MSGKAWTAESHAPWLVKRGMILRAQCKSSKAELLRRLIADDPAWYEGVTFTQEKRWPNRSFRRGLAFRCEIQACTES